MTNASSVSTPAALAVRVVGSVPVGRGPGGGAAIVTRPAPSQAGRVWSRPGRPAAGGPRAPSAGAGRAGWSGRRIPLCRLSGRGRGAGDDQEGMGQQGQGDVPVPARPAAHLVVVQADLGLGLLEGLLDGLITNGRFCCTRRVRLGLSWWHRPLRLRRSGLQTDAVLVGEPDELDLDRLPPVQPPPRRRPSLGSGLPAAGALDSRARRRHPAGGAEGTGGA